MKLRFLDYRYAEAVLEHRDFQDAKQQILEIFQQAPVPLLDPENVDSKARGVKRRKRKPRKDDPGDRYFFLPVSQIALNRYLDEQFAAKGWLNQPAIVDPGRADRTDRPSTKLKGDYKKGRLQVEVQFGNMARWYTDVFKFQLSYSLGEIDVGILVVPTQHFANLIDENVAYFERVERELPWAKMSLTLPIWVIGIEPDDEAMVRQCYERAAAVWATHSATKGETIVPIPYQERIAEESQDAE